MSEPGDPDFAEVDPTGRFTRYEEILGKGASKTVYRAFDEYEGIEVAWNQVKLRDFLQSPEELERLCSEIHLLKTLKHKNIMKFYASWVDVSGRNINFITEMFTSGTLRQYRHKYRKVSIRAVKHWCRQILEGLVYLHSHDPPVIHRDIKCDNIFVNGNQGEVKIGDLGLATVLSKSPVALCVGTPEFMAPEVYEEQYNELVDIYSFGMCILEMTTLEYPYSECTHPVQIYKKVTSGMMPDALFKVQDSKVRQFIEKCLTTATERLPASELLKDPFLQTDDDLIPTCQEEVQVGRLQLQPSLSSCSTNGCLLPNDKILPEVECVRECDELKTSILGTELLELQENSRSSGLLITIKGNRIEDGRIFLRLRIEEKDGARNVYFYFDVEVDTALTVATEMVAQLEYLTNVDVMHIADMIDGELLSLIPDWRTGPGIEDSIQSTISSRGCLGDYINSIKHDALSLQNFQFSSFASGHSRFHEDRRQSDEIEGWLRQEGVPSPLDARLDVSGASRQPEEESHAEVGTSKRTTFLSFRKSARASCLKSSTRGTMGRFLCGSFRKESVDISACSLNVLDGCETDIENELRWLKSEYQREMIIQQSSLTERNRGCSSPPPAVVNQADSTKDGVGASSSSCLLEENAAHILASSKSDLSHSNRSRRADDSTRPPRQNNEVKRRRSSLRLFAARRLYTGILLRGCLPRKKSLKVDAIDS